MPNKTVSVNSGGLGAVFFTALLAYLKINGYLAISWLLVFAPMWAGIALIALFGAVVLMFMALAAVLGFKNTKRRRP